MATKKILKKIIKNGVEYYLPEGGGGGGSDLDIGGVSAIVDMKLGDYDSLFSITSGLYKILNAIDTDDEIGLTSGESWSQIVASATSMSKISHCYAVMCYIANSSVAMNQIVGNSSATKEISECWNSISIIAENQLSSDIYLGSVNGLTYLFAYTTAQDAFFTSAERKTEIISDNIMVIVNNNTLLTNINDDPVVEVVIASSEEAMLAIVASTDKLDIVDENSVIMTGIATNASALTAMSDQNFTSYILEDHDYLVACTSDDDGKARINSMAADDLLPAIFYWTGLSGYSTFADLAANDSAMEIVQSSDEAMLIIISNAEANQYMDWKPGNNTLVYWKFEGDSNDYSGNNRHATTNNITYESNGKIQVAKFGTNSYAYADNSAFDIYGSMNYTYSICIKATDLSGNYKSFGICEANSYGTQDKSIDIYSDGHASAYIYQSAEKRANTPNGTIQVNNWYNLISTFDGTTLKIYVNGVLKGTVSTTSSYDFSNPRLILSRYGYNTGTGYFQGYVSRFIFENKCWSESEVTDYVNKIKGKYGIS